MHSQKCYTAGPAPTASPRRLTASQNGQFRYAVRVQHDISERKRVEAALAQLKQAIQAEGISAISFIPIMEGGLLLGKFMAYFDETQDHSDDHVEVARTIARHLGFGVERIKGENAAQRLAAIVESSHDAIVSKDLNGVISTWNRGAERLFGYSASEVVGKPITIIIPPDRLEEEPLILGRIRRGELVDHFQTIRRRKDGSLVDISLTISPVRDATGRIIGASKIARNITDQKIAEAKVRDSERHLQDLLAAIPAAIYTTDQQGKITYFNEAAVNLAGRTPVIGTRVTSPRSRRSSCFAASRPTLPSRSTGSTSSGPDTLTGTDVAPIWTDVLSRQITYPGEDLAGFEQNLGQFMPGWMALDMRLMGERFISEGMISDAGDIDRLTKLLNRPLRTYRDFAAEIAASA
ncbi:PAS domain-containing protein [Mesorhizobium cantuariense]